jgi:hypothetical protein
MGLDNSYLVLVCPDRFILAQIYYLSTEALDKTTNSIISSAGIVRLGKYLVLKFVWSCPANSIDQLYCDTRGDLVLQINSSLFISGHWNSNFPVVLDEYLQDYIVFQSLMDQTIGPRLSRLQPLTPTSGIIQNNILKRYSSGLKSLIMSPSKHTFRLFGNVLYEYSPKRSENNSSIQNSDLNDSNEKSSFDNVIRDSEEYFEKIITKIFSPPIEKITAE